MDCEYVSKMRSLAPVYEVEVATQKRIAGGLGSVVNARWVMLSPMSREAIQNSQVFGRCGWPTVIGEAPDKVQVQSPSQA